MICKKCGKEISDNSVFCTYCGFNQSLEYVENQEVIEEEQLEVVEEEHEVDVCENVVEQEEQVVLPEEDKSNFSTAIYTNEFEYTKKVFNRYYNAEFVNNGLGSYIALQIILLNLLVIPGIAFAFIYWVITNPITKAAQWRNFLFENKGNQPLYRFFFNENSLVVRRNRVEECTMQYKDFKKIIYSKSGILFVSKTQNFFIPLEELKNREEIKEILLKANVKFKIKYKK